MPAAATHPSLAPEQPTSAWSDDLLLLVMSEHASQRGPAEAALTIFMDRWGRPMERLVEGWCAFPPGRLAGADTVLLELWRKVFFRAESFADEGLTGEALQRRVAAWLTQIARNVLRSEIAEFQERKLCEIPDEVVESIAERDPDHVLDGGDDEPRTPPRLAAVIDCLQMLPEREMDVLRTTAEYLNADQETEAMPKHLCEALCQRYRIPQPTLRQVRKRALDRLKKCVAPKLAAIDQGE